MAHYFMNDNLDTLSDRELDLIFEREVVGEEPLKLAMASRDNGESGALFESNPFHHEIPTTRESIDEFCAKYPQYKVCEREVTRAHYATNPAAVIPWLEKHAITAAVFTEGSWCVTINAETGEGETFDMPQLGDADAPEFSRAAAIALVRAKRSAQ